MTAKKSEHYLLIYDFVPDYLTRRTEFRKEHFGQAQAAVAAGDLLMGGALEAPAEHAFLLFTSREAAERFANTDVYGKKGLVTRWRVRRWHTVVGPLAAEPVTL